MLSSLLPTLKRKKLCAGEQKWLLAVRVMATQLGRGAGRWVLTCLPAAHGEQHLTAVTVKPVPFWVGMDAVEYTQGPKGWMDSGAPKPVWWPAQVRKIPGGVCRATAFLHHSRHPGSSDPRSDLSLARGDICMTHNLAVMSVICPFYASVTFSCVIYHINGYIVGRTSRQPLWALRRRKPCQTEAQALAGPFSDRMMEMKGGVPKFPGIPLYRASWASLRLGSRSRRFGGGQIRGQHCFSGVT